MCGKNAFKRFRCLFSNMYLRCKNNNNEQNVAENGIFWSQSCGLEATQFDGNIIKNSKQGVVIREQEI